MDKAVEMRGHPPLPPVTPCVLQSDAAQLKVKVLRWIVCVFPLSPGPSHATRFTSLLTDPAPSLTPTHSPHSLTPSPPSSKPGPRRLSHAVGAYVSHLESPPHPGLYPLTVSIILINRHMGHFCFFPKINKEIKFLVNLTNRVATLLCQHIQVTLCITPLQIKQKKKLLHRCGLVWYWSPGLWAAVNILSKVLIRGLGSSEASRCFAFQQRVKKEVNCYWKEGKRKMFLFVCPPLPGERSRDSGRLTRVPSLLWGNGNHRVAANPL